MIAYTAGGQSIEGEFGNNWGLMYFQDEGAGMFPTPVRREPL